MDIEIKRHSRKTNLGQGNAYNFVNYVVKINNRRIILTQCGCFDTWISKKEVEQIKKAVLKGKWQIGRKYIRKIVFVIEKHTVIIKGA